MGAAIEIANLVVEFAAGPQTVRALDGLSLTVEAGCVFGFLGPNGAGKTTAMHTLLGFIRPASGRALVFGEDVSKSIARRRIGFLPEHSETYRFLTGRELLAFAGRLFRMRGAALSRRVNALLEQVGMSGAADRRISTYSRGMLQRIGLAQAMVNDPDLLILDEPTGGFDPIGRIAIRSLIAGLRAQGKTVFFSSHELSEVELTCDRIAIIARGRIVAGGTVAELSGRGESLEKVFIAAVSA